jgi:dTDP-4-amino-4,6-dideoxygalactose transaminase
VGTPLHRQEAFGRFPVAGGALPVSDALAEGVLSLPMHPYLEPDVQDRIVAAVRDALAEVAA